MNSAQLSTNVLNSCTFLRGKGGKKNPAMLRPELGAAEKCLQLNPAWFYLPRTAAKIKEHRQMQNLLLVKLHCELLTLISKQEKSCSFLKYLSYRKQKREKGQQTELQNGSDGPYPSCLFTQFTWCQWFELCRRDPSTPGNRKSSAPCDFPHRLLRP